MNLEQINAEWLNKKIIQHYGDCYGNLKRFSDDTSNIIKYSMITKHTTNTQKMTPRFKLMYFLWFECKENQNNEKRC